MTDVRKHLIARGRVQGVGFRYHAQEAAWRLDLHGWIKNLACGERVEITVAGDEQSVATFVEWCRQGPTMAHVDELTVGDDASTDPLKPFAILR